MPTRSTDPIHAPRTLHAAYARAVLSHLLAVKPAVAQVLTPAHLRHLDDLDPAGRCTLQEWHGLMDMASQHLGGRDLVPALSEQFKPWHTGLLGLTLMTCSSVLDVAGLLQRLHPLLDDVFTIERGVVGQRFYLRLHATTVEASPQLARLSLAVWVHRLRWLTGQADLLIDVNFEGTGPVDVNPYQRIFGGQVRFDQGDNTMWGDAACLNMPIMSRDAVSHSLLHGQAVKQLNLLSNGKDLLIDQLQRLIKAQLTLGNVTLDTMAQALKLPSRTLQRRLEESGLNFRLLVDDVRKTQAQHHLRDTCMPVSELAGALGFSDPTSFNRAFKRWTGSSPGAYRRSGA